MNKLVVQHITFLLGLIFMSVAICGFIPSLTTEKDGQRLLFDTITVGIVQNTLYALTGLAALGCSLSYRFTERFLMISATLYGALTMISLVANNNLPYFAASEGNNILQFAMAVGGLVIGTWPMPKDVTTNVPPKDLETPPPSGSEPPAPTAKNP